MLYSLKKGTGHVIPKDKNAKKTLWDNTILLSPHPHPAMSSAPPAISSPIIYSNNTIDWELLVEMRQSNKCETVIKLIFNLHLESGEYPSVNILSLLQKSSHNYWFHPPKQLTRKNQRTKNEIPIPKTCILLPSYWYTQPREKRSRLPTQALDRWWQD